jgi:hypothetical protein
MKCATFIKLYWVYEKAKKAGSIFTVQVTLAVMMMEYFGARW